jgi:zinc transport system substrate-binding protein
MHCLRPLFLYSACALCALLLVASCGTRTDSGKPVVFVSVLPHQYLAQRIAGERFEVHSLIGPGQSPHSYSPTPSEISRLTTARAYFRAGVEFEEALLPRIERTARTARIVDLRDGIPLRHIDEHETHGGEPDEDEGGEHHDHENHGHEGHRHEHHDHAHHEGAPDPHVWLSPTLAARQALSIRETLAALDPEGEEIYRANYVALENDLLVLDSVLSTVLAPVRGAALFVYHPAFGYFADQYGLKQMPVETGGKEPSARALARLIALAREHQPAAIFVQPQFSRKSAEAIAAQINCTVVPIDPLPREYLHAMREMAAAVRQGIRAPADTAVHAHESETR